MRQKASVEGSRSPLWSPSVVIAVLALSLSIYSAWQTRKTAHLSVRPYMVTSFYFNKDGAGFTHGNYGQGPAITRTFEVELDGQRVDSWDDLARKLDIHGGYKFSVPRPGDILPPGKADGDYAWIFWVPKEQPEDFEKLTSNENRVTIRTCYCSLYEDCWKVSNQIPELSPEEVFACDRPFGELFKGRNHP
jgi:hypothetical protein